MRWRVIALTGLVTGFILGSLPARVTAQSVGVAANIDLKRFSGEPGTGVLDTTTPGIMLTASAPVTRLASVGAELGLEWESTVARTTDAQQGRLETTYTNQMRTVSVLVGVHPVVSRRVRANVLGGLTFVHFRRTIQLERTPNVSPPPAQPPASIFIDRVAAPTVGSDLDIFVAEHLSISAGVRAHAMKLVSELGGFSVRPFAGVKWVIGSQ